ncbi:MAG: type 4a pilus biogenesis protein PilO [Thermodesulfovibrionales bacterium]|nr:type 4a pilus biogenesis protein PilO [Thermodesulfovibrionales bacterium]
MDIKTIKARLEKLSGREKVIGIMTVVALIVIAPYVLLYSPSEKALRMEKQRLSDLQNEAAALETSLTEQSRQVAAAAPRLKPVMLPKADDLHGIFRSISTRATELGVDFISIAPEAVSEKEGFIEMRLKLELRLKYKQLYDFVAYLSAKHRLFLIESLRFETNDAVYPSGVAIIKAVTYLEKK